MRAKLTILVMAFVLGFGLLASPSKNRSLFSAGGASEALAKAVQELKRKNMEEGWISVEIQRDSKDAGWVLVFSKQVGNPLTEWLVVVGDSGDVRIIDPR